mmetsp:Transcript_22234/g.33285  ORF Transcript_22234/g.33285 Transcript_22234/m.33285 type:complete len:311 (-) Transcript_22234:91-1023(-)|eukprot:CAMPEP_0203673570 /NCGR_PEP_ID=MMETSP0090-20130426/12998_1 /ASSEMBLY_ACC=CAM_ASM_001088 /TAXON_ID=426623 /ORGANISM="Chaetoceros affinis, Strain CCMP159" /LENGTH=310 /DNA_ID=CAMNT_0050539257 /DNA_START=119 /DNA_END=1051 /DNA_ORIENTATION=-
MTTRAAAVATSQRAKQRLVNLLFQSDYGGKGRRAHNKLDFASYSYYDLKAAYLKRVQSIHPDKVAAAAGHHLNFELGSDIGSGSGSGSGLDSEKCNRDLNDIPSSSSSSSSSSTSPSPSSSWNETSSWQDVVNATKKSNATAFIELQEAWKTYEKLSKLMRRGRTATESQMRGVQEDFTAFGVGCSFSDSVEESMRRADIMDQACKGWCAAGQLGEGNLDVDGNVDGDVDGDVDGNVNANATATATTTANLNVNVNVNDGRINIPLVGDDLFSDVTDSTMNTCTAEGKRAPSGRKSLVDHLVRRFKRSFR